MPNNELSSGQRDKTSSRFQKWLRERYPRVYGFFFSEPPIYIRHFFPILVTLGLIGGAAALWIPSNTGWLRQSGLSDDAEQKSISDLRLHFLYITGGIIAILTLLQTNWKNQGDRLKIDADIKKNEQDAEKNDRDHTRQIHAERRSRYTTAVEQLANEKAAVRLGGIYTLVGLADEWLADDSLTKDKQNEEGQVIINNLCSYIRLPFPLAEKIDEHKAHKKFEELKEKESENLLSKLEPFELKALSKRFANSQDYKEPEDITADYATFHEEQDVRRTIFVEMGKRSSVISNKEESDVTVTPGAWSDFDFDFSRAPIFYPLNGLTIEKGNFSNAKFYADTTFFKVAFNSNANFGKATFNSDPNFGKATFNSDAYFGEATFNSDAYFGEATFNSDTYFSEATFNSDTYFDEATFNSDTYFSEATFNSDTYFSEATFNSDAYFGEATFNSDAYFDEATFNSDAYFREATFNSDAYFREATFNSDAYFREATFNSDADFGEATFNSDAYFGEATFNSNAYFGEATFNSNTYFSEATFNSDADFGKATFNSNTYFFGAIFTNNANFTGVTFTSDAYFLGVSFFSGTYFLGARFFSNADFTGATFISNVYFHGAIFTESEPIFAITETDSEKEWKARFSATANPQDYDFSVAAEGKPISCGTASLLGKSFTIPLGTVLFDPTSWDEQKEFYTRVSVPAK